MEINGLDLQEIAKLLSRKRNRYLSLLLSDLEKEITTKVSKEDWHKIRKVILDYFNDFCRAVVKVIVGQEIEGL